MYLLDLFSVQINRHVTIVLGVVSPTGWAVGRDELIDEFLDGGVCRVVFGELAEVLGGFECEHWGFSFVAGIKKPARWRA